MPVWPSTLPQAPLSDGFRETVPDAVLRTDMEQGPAKLRRRTTAATASLSMTFLMSAAQVLDLEAFFKDTLAFGALAFDFFHPRTGAAVSCRFRQPPALAALNGGFFKVALELEVLP